MKNRITILSACAFLLACSAQKKLADQGRLFPSFDKEGHRGSRGLMPENTIPAMQKAIDLGVTTLEMDVVISKDKKVVVSHDTYFNADFTTTTDGTYITKAEAVNYLLYHMDYDSIRKYDVGLKPHPSFPRQQKIAVYKPLLSELIRASERYAKEKRVPALWYNIETKLDKGGDNVRHPAPGEFADLLMQVVLEEGIASRTVIQSFDIRTLQWIHQKHADMKTSLLIENNENKALDEQLKELGFIPFVYSPNYAMVTQALVNACHEKGMKIVPWTVNKKEDIEKLKVLGVDGIITDYPDLFQ